MTWGGRLITWMMLAAYFLIIGIVSWPIIVHEISIIINFWKG